MTDTFNLICQDWIPVRRRSGTIEQIAPWKLTAQVDSDPVTDIAWPRRDFNAATHEFLIGLLTTALAPTDYDAWMQWWRTPPSPATLLSGFERVQHAFNLDGDGPRFMQDLDPLNSIEPSDITEILMDSPVEQTIKDNKDHFVKRNRHSALGPAASAIALYTLQTYAPEGGRGYTTSLRGGGPATTIVCATHPELGDTLWGRTWPNVETKEQLRDRDARVKGDLEDIDSGLPWLRPTKAFKPDGETTPAEVHPAVVFWGMPRRIRLIVDDTHPRNCAILRQNDSKIVTHFKQKNLGTKYSIGFNHPLSPYRNLAKQKDSAPEWHTHHFRRERISYSDWPRMLVRNAEGSHRPAMAVHDWKSGKSRLPETKSSARFAAFGYWTDKNKTLAWVESEGPLWATPNEDTEQDMQDLLRRAVDGGDFVATVLRQALAKKRERSDRGISGTALNTVIEQFYRSTEPYLEMLLRDGLQCFLEASDDDDPAVLLIRQWHDRLTGAAVELFNQSMPASGVEHGSMSTYAERRKILQMGLRGQKLLEALGLPQSVKQNSQQQETSHD